MILIEEIGCDGVINFLLLDGYAQDKETSFSRNELIITPHWITSFVGNALCSVARFRSFANSPEIEYGLEFEIRVDGESVPILGYDSGDNRIFGKSSEGSTLFPRYSVRDTNSFSELLKILDQDFWNACGRDWEHELKVNFSSVL